MRLKPMSARSSPKTGWSSLCRSRACERCCSNAAFCRRRLSARASLSRARRCSSLSRASRTRICVRASMPGVEIPRMIERFALSAALFGAPLGLGTGLGASLHGDASSPSPEPSKLSDFEVRP